MSAVDATFIARVERMVFGRESDSIYGWHVDEVDGLSVGEVQEVGVAQYDGTGQYNLDNVVRDPRIITISGVAHARSMWELGQFEILARGCLIAKTAEAPFTWSEYGRTLRCDVRRYRGWAFRRVGDTRSAEYTARFRAPSQLVYGESDTFGPGTTVQVVHRGTYPAYDVLVVTGNMPSGYRIESGGRAYVVAQGLSAGQTHRIDMRTGVLYRNGFAQIGAVSAPRKLPALPGVTTFTLVPVSGSGQLTVQHADTHL